MFEERPPYTLSDDKARLDVAAIHCFLSEESYWARGIPRELVERSIANSLCLGVYHGAEQAAFLRVVTDYATFAWICDVYVAVPHRKRGLSKWLMEAVLRHPELQGLRRRILATRDAHELYKQFGFTPLAKPQNFLDIRAENPYGGG